jgi:hypothetical protein
MAEMTSHLPAIIIDKNIIPGASKLPFGIYVQKGLPFERNTQYLQKVFAMREKNIQPLIHMVDGVGCILLSWGYLEKEVFIANICNNLVYVRYDNDKILIPIVADRKEVGCVEISGPIIPESPEYQFRDGLFHKD